MNNLRLLRTKRSTYVAVTLTAFSLCVAREAHAQEWLKDRQSQEGAGIRTGDLEIHPGIGAEIGYDSNYFLRSYKDGPNVSNAAPAAPVEGGGIIRITPSLTLSTLGEQRRAGELTPPTVSFHGGVAATYREFIGPADLRNQRNVSGAANLRLDILPQHPIGLGIYGTYERTIRPTTGANPDPNLSFNRDDLGAGAEVVLQPGRGTLDWRFGYQFHASLFEDELGVPYTNLTHEAYTRGRWRFRPRTALLYDASLRWLQYTQSDRSVSALTDGSPTRARIGLTGLVTPRLGFLGMVGYGATFFNHPNAVYVRQYDSVIAQAELKYFLSAAPTPGDEGQAVSLSVSSIALGYNRDFQTSYLGNYYGLDRGYLKFAYLFGGRVLVTLEGGLGAIEYPDVFANGTTPGSYTQISSGFTDLRADATLFGEYRFTNSFGINTTFRYTENMSDKQLPLGNGGNGTSLYDMSWRRFEAFLGLRLFL